VPFRTLPWPQYTAPAPFDLICLARSPEYTPATCDRLSDAIRERFIDENCPNALASAHCVGALGISARARQTPPALRTARAGRLRWSSRQGPFLHFRWLAKALVLDHLYRLSLPAEVLISQVLAQRLGLSPPPVLR
jgi:hypothetical protein